MSSRRWIEIILGVALIFAATVPASAADMGIVTGSEKGTYYQFGLNLQRLMKSNGINLTVSPSKGSVENVFAVYQRPATQLGIVQSDVLAFVARVETDPVLQRIAKKIKMVFPLYNEEIHILGRNVASFDDLADKRVAIGREGSGTYLTARLMFKVAEVEPKQMVLIDTDQALAERTLDPVRGRDLRARPIRRSRGQRAVGPRRRTGHLRGSSAPQSCARRRAPAMTLSASAA